MDPSKLDEIDKPIVIDGFYSDPMAVRNLALKAEYVDVTQLNYPGFQSRQSYVSKALKKRFESITGFSLEIDPHRLTFGKFRVMLADTGSNLKVHLDGASDWTGVLYLNPDRDCQGGTGFYRHKRTGLSGPPKQEQMNQLGYGDIGEFQFDVVKKDSLNPRAWELINFVEMKFNRLTLFRGNYFFHAHTCSFGNSLETGRMTQNFFFNEACQA